MKLQNYSSLISKTLEKTLFIENTPRCWFIRIEKSFDLRKFELFGHVPLCSNLIHNTFFLLGVEKCWIKYYRSITNLLLMFFSFDSIPYLQNWKNIWWCRPSKNGHFLGWKESEVLKCNDLGYVLGLHNCWWSRNLSVYFDLWLSFFDFISSEGYLVFIENLKLLS